MSMIDTIKDAITLVQKVDNIDVVRALMQVQQDAMTLMQDKHALIEENHALRDQVRQLESKLAFNAQLVRRDGMCFAQGDAEPYCPHCWEVDHLAIHLARHAPQGGGGFFCRKCGNNIRR